MELLKFLPVPLLLVVTLIAALSGNVIKKYYSKVTIDYSEGAYVYSAVTSLICTVCMIIFSGFRISMSWYTVLLGLLFGICTMLAAVLTTKAMCIGPMSYTVVISSSSTVITALSGFLFWDEELGVLKIIGLVLMAGCFVFSVKKDEDGKKKSLLWFLLSLFSAFAGAGVGLLQKVHQSSAYREELMGFLIIAFVFSLISSLIPLLFRKRKLLVGEKLQPVSEKTETNPENMVKEEDAICEEPCGDAKELRSVEKADVDLQAKQRKFRRLLFVLLLISGIVIALNNVINLYLAGVMDSAVFFPLVNGVGLVLSIVAGLVVFREKLTLMQWVGIACGVVATLFLCL